MSCEITNTFDLCLVQNQTFRLPFTLFQDDGVTPINLTGWSFTGSIKEQAFDTVPLLFFTASINNAVTGEVQLYLGADTTWLLNKPKYVYDVIANNTTISPAETLRLLKGKVSVNAGVTEP
jgi:hypothetical protein